MTNIITVDSHPLTIRDLDETNLVAWIDLHGDELGRFKIIEWIVEHLVELGPNGSQTLSNVQRNLVVTTDGVTQYTLNGCYISDISSWGDSANKKKVQSIQITYTSKV